MIIIIVIDWLEFDETFEHLRYLSFDRSSYLILFSSDFETWMLLIVKCKYIKDQLLKDSLVRL